MIDLHLHSNRSDGFDSMEAVVQKAKEAGLTEISFVDHDCLMDVREARRLSQIYDLHIIPGIEISAFDFERQRKVHILGYGYKENAPHISTICGEVSQRRHEHSLNQLERIIEAGYDVDVAKVEAYAAQSGVIYKQHMMHGLTDAPYSSTSYQQLYKSLFKGEGVAAGDITYVCAMEAVEAIVKDGGIAVLAHPGQLDSFDLIPKLVAHGLGGIERNHFDHSLEHMEIVEAMAEKYDLIMTGGSDYHGIYGREVGVGEVLSPQSIVKSLV